MLNLITDDLHFSYVTKCFVLENAAVQMQQKGLGFVGFRVEGLKHIYFGSFS